MKQRVFCAATALTIVFAAAIWSEQINVDINTDKNPLPENKPILVINDSQKPIVDDEHKTLLFLVP